jgi:hypothetical protein
MLILKPILLSVWQSFRRITGFIELLGKPPLTSREVDEVPDFKM